MAPKATIEFDEKNLSILDTLAKITAKGNRTRVVNDLINEAIVKDVKLPVVSKPNSDRSEHFMTINEILQFPEIELNELHFDAKGATPAFRENFYNLDLPYRVAVYQLLLHLTKGSSTSRAANKKKMQLGVTKNIAVYYYDPKENGYFRAFYMVIAGSMGNHTIPEWLEAMNVTDVYQSEEDPNSPIWISSKERFTADRYSTKIGIGFYKEMLRHLKLDESYVAVQLSLQNLKDLVNYFQIVMPIRD